MADIVAKKVKRASGRETETLLLEAHCVGVMVNDDGSIVIEAFPESSRADGLRLYIGPDSAAACAANWAAWARIKRNG